jgi:hypothetical protein
MISRHFGRLAFFAYRLVRRSIRVCRSPLLGVF